MKKYYVKILKKSLWMMIPALLFSLSSKAQNQGSHLMVAVGAAYKPCVTRGRNHHGSLRVGASAGSDLNKAIGAVHVGYEHTYNLYDGWSFFFSVKEDITIRGKERFKTGVNLGLKIPL